jgi:hypothetical protein
MGEAAHVVGVQADRFEKLDDPVFEFPPWG